MRRDVPDPRGDNASALPSKPRVLLSELVLAASSSLGPAVRRALPSAVKDRLAAVLGGLVARLETGAEAQFHARGVPLAEVAPLGGPDSFSGPIILVNDALAWGGAERQVVNTFQGLSARTDRPVRLLCLRLGKAAEYDFHRASLSDQGGAVRNVVSPIAARRTLQRCAAGDALSRIASTTDWLPFDIRHDILRFVAEFIAQKPAVVHAWQDATSIVAGYAARLAGVPHIVVSGRNMNPRRFAYFRPYMAHAYQELATCANITMLNNSDAGAADYSAWLSLPRDRFRVLRNGIDLSAIRRADPVAVARQRRSLGVPDDAPLIGSIFRFHPEKRPRLWIESATKIARAEPNAHFVIYGEGPLKREAAAFAASRGLAHRIHLPGTTEDPALALSTFDLFLLTSEFEGTPNTIIEASALGVPVVATDAGGTVESIEPGSTGLIVADDADSIARDVLAVLDDPAFRARAAAGGPRFVRERFGLDRMIAETLDAYGMRARERA